MLRALHSIENPKYVNTFVVTINGYFGDGDEYFHIEESSAKCDEKSVEMYYKAYKYLKDSTTYIESKQELPEEYQDYISGASWDDDILPSGINELTLYYYDSFGQMHDVEIL